MPGGNDSKLMYITWTVDGNTGSDNGRQLTTNVASSEPHLLANTYTDGLTYKITIKATFGSNRGGRVTFVGMMAFSSKTQPRMRIFFLHDVPIISRSFSPHGRSAAY